MIGEAQVEYMLAGRFTAERLSAYIDAENRWMLLVRDGAEPIGYFSYARQTNGEMKLEQLYLLAERRGGGLGRRMLEHVEEHARALGCTVVMLTVAKRNTQALRMYEHSGFVVREAAVFDIGAGFVMDDYVLTKAL
jgi:GNAT superfamily N-acetyltransferase